MAGTKRSCRKSFCCFSSCASGEEGQHPPPSAGPRNSPSAIDNTTETHPGSPKRSEAPIAGPSNVVSMKYEGGQHVDLNRHDSVTHQCDKAPLSESQNILRESEGEGVNARSKVSGFPQGDEPSSSGSSKVPVKAEGKQVDVNPNVSEARSDAISSIKHIVQAGGEKVEVNLDELMVHISKLLKLRKQEMRQQKKTSNASDHFHWPEDEGLQKLKAILSWGTDLRNLKEMMSPLFECVSTLTQVINGPVKAILTDIGKASAVTAGLLVVAYTLERFHDLSDNKEKYWGVIKEMSNLARVVKGLKESPKKTLDVIEEATALVVEGAIMCCTQIDCSGWKRFLLTSKDKADLSDIKGKLIFMYLTISLDIAIRNSTGIERLLAAKENPLLSRIYPEQAVGIDKSIEEVVSRLEIESAQNAVTVIVHGFGGMGKTTLADAVVSKDMVVSKLVGFKYSKVRLSQDSVIENLQNEILKDLMEPGETIRKITTHEDGQRELLKRLEQVQAFIYIDDVLDGNALKKLLPEDMGRAKKVRLLLTARNEDVKYACPRPCTEPKIYKMEGIHRPAAKFILDREIKDGINESQFNDIIYTCGGIPLMLTLAAPFIGRAHNKREAYSTLVLQKNKWPSEAFGPMHCAFAYEALPDDCKEPFLDICSFFKGWAWETVEDIVGKHKLEMLERRALVTRTTNDVAFVHDVILTLAHQKSKESSEGKEVRLAFTSASKLTEFLEEEGAEGIKGIWLSDNKDASEISAATLDLMSKSLRVLRLGNVTNVEGKCSGKFQELLFFEAKVRELPFHDLSKLKKLTYLSYVPNDELKLSKMPSSLRHMEFDGSSLSDAFQIHSLPQLEHLRILRLVNFFGLKNLPKKLGDQVEGLHELSLSNCRSITKLPDSISRLQSLRVLKMDGCSSLTELPVDFGSPCCRSLLNLPPCVGNLTDLVELNLDGCIELKSIPEGIGECSTLTKQPVGLCNLSSITHLSFEGCKSLKKLPDWFGQLASLKTLCFRRCTSLQKLPESFGQLKNLEVLDLGFCHDLRELCNDFHCLSSLQNLDLNGCRNLEKLPLDFHRLTSLQRLDLSGCDNLEGESMNHLVNMNALQLVHIRRSEQLEKWAEIQRDGVGSGSFTVISGQDLSISRVEKEKIEKRLFSELDGLLTNTRGEQFHLSDLLSSTLMLVMWDLELVRKDSFIEDMIDEMHIKIIYIGPDFDKFSTKVKDNIFVVNVPTTRATQMLEKVHLTLDLEPDPRNEYLQIDKRMQVGDGHEKDEYRPCWRFLTEAEMREFVVSNCNKRYLRLKQVEADRDEESC